MQKRLFFSTQEQNEENAQPPISASHLTDGFHSTKNRTRIHGRYGVDFVHIRFVRTATPFSMHASSTSNTTNQEAVFEKVRVLK